MAEYLEAAGGHSATAVRARELSWRRYAEHVRSFSAQYRKRVDGHVTRTMRRWTARVGPLAENDWLTFAWMLFDIGTRQGAATRDSSERRGWIDLEFARFVDLLDVDGVMAWNDSVIDRSAGRSFHYCLQEHTWSMVMGIRIQRSPRLSPRA